MKKFLLLVALVGATISFCCCSNDDDVEIAYIVGKWTFSKSIGYESCLHSKKEYEYDRGSSANRYNVTFKEDGTGVKIEEYYNWSSKFIYSINGNQLQIKYLDNDIEEYTIKQLSSTELVLNYHDKEINLRYIDCKECSYGDRHEDRYFIKTFVP